jgi:hypothetical protein
LDGKKPVIVRFKVGGEDLVEEEKFGLRYKILQNNEFSIVAAWSISAIERNQNTLWSWSSTKRTAVSAGPMILGEEGDAAALGSCTH